jgi:N-acetylglucosaminyl-diphospho-decaprenol L-rhamnosyltransferase
MRGVFTGKGWDGVRENQPAKDEYFSDAVAPELTVIVVNYNTRELTLACLRTLYENTFTTTFHTVVVDNASTDGSVEAIAQAFPQVELISSHENHGFAGGNNLVARQAKTEWLLLLNPDTEVHYGAVDNLLAFSKSHPEAGITGGRTVFRDGSLNALSCLNRITPWSAVCTTIGLTSMFRGSPVFDTENIGGWKRDSERQVDIVVGCFLMIKRHLWEELEGFDTKFFMYGEEADLCLRAGKIGYKPMITPEAEIMHLVGAASDSVAGKVVMVAKGRSTLIRDHWSPLLVPVGVALMWLWGGLRVVAARVLALSGRKEFQLQKEKWEEIWSKRQEWLAGY